MQATSSFCLNLWGLPNSLLGKWANFLLGKWAKMKYLTMYWVVLPHFCCNDIFFWDVDKSGQWVVRYERMVVKIGLTPCKIIHWSPSWQHLSSGAISSPYLWVLGLIVACAANHTQFTFQKYPHWGLRKPPLLVYSQIIYTCWFSEVLTDSTELFHHYKKRKRGSCSILKDLEGVSLFCTIQ
jgi:hypothetical protein